MSVGKLRGDLKAEVLPVGKEMGEGEKVIEDPESREGEGEVGKCTGEVVADDRSGDGTTGGNFNTGKFFRVKDGR